MEIVFFLLMSFRKADNFASSLWGNDEIYEVKKLTPGTRVR